MDYILAHWWLGNNFGDRLTPFLVEKITGKRCVWTWTKGPEPVYLVCGSILGEEWQGVTVWGAGAIAHDSKLPKADYRAVRGPKTRQLALLSGSACPEIYGDPAILLPRLWKPIVPRRHKVGIVPHYMDLKACYEAYGGDPEILIIHVTDPVETVIKNILSCATIVSSSLHGLIVADAYGIPNVWVEFSDGIVGRGFKFADYWLGIEAEPRPPVNLRVKKNLEEVLAHARRTEIPGRVSARLWDACPFLRRG